MKDVLISALQEVEFQRNRLGVTKVDYANAVERLYDVAIAGTGQSGIAASVLLSAYDGYTFTISIPELGGLDLGLLDAALIVIRGRVIDGIEPHEIIENGPQRFKRLVQRFADGN